MRLRMLSPIGTAEGKVGHRQTPYKQRTRPCAGFFVWYEKLSDDPL